MVYFPYNSDFSDTSDIPTIIGIFGKNQGIGIIGNIRITRNMIGIIRKCMILDNSLSFAMRQVLSPPLPTLVPLSPAPQCFSS